MEEMCNRRVTIKDIAEELGVSTATVSNVINGKTKKISDKTIERVQKKLEEKHYIPNMAGILLAQNSSKIICVVISNHKKYEGKILQDPFISALMDSMSLQAEKNDYFMMIKISRIYGFHRILIIIFTSYIQKTLHPLRAVQVDQAAHQEAL